MRIAVLLMIIDQLHIMRHAIFKPDDIARARAVQIYQNKYPAAAAAAQAIVIYPTNRKGNNAHD